jgi:hypothetical protein
MLSHSQPWAPLVSFLTSFIGSSTVRGTDGTLFRPGYAMGKEERGYTPRSGEKGATPNVHIAGSWNPLAGNQWTGQQMTLNELSSRPGSSTQRYRDGTIRPNRAEKLLVNEPHGLNAKRGLKQHETKQKDGSPWEKTPACFDLGFGADWITTTGGQHSGPPDDAYARPSRHADALARRCTPHMYQCIQQTKAVPSYAYVAKAGAAVGPSTGPTAPDWAMNPATVVGTSRATSRLNPPTQSPRLLKAENDLRMQLLELRIRSEQRARQAALALATDIEKQPLCDPGYTPLPSPRMVLSPRLVLASGRPHTSAV